MRGRLLRAPVALPLGLGAACAAEPRDEPGVPAGHRPAPPGDDLSSLGYL